jgi:hypothetical protein
MPLGSFARPLVAIGPKCRSQTLTENGAGSSLAPAEAAMPGLSDELPPNQSRAPLQRLRYQASEFNLYARNGNRDIVRFW